MKLYDAKVKTKIKERCQLTAEEVKSWLTKKSINNFTIKIGDCVKVQDVKIQKGVNNLKKQFSSVIGKANSFRVLPLMR